MGAAVREVEVDGIRLHVREEGHGPALIFLHGWLVDHQSWYAVARQLAPQYRCVLIDLPGFGTSTKVSSALTYSARSIAGILAKALPRVVETPFTLCAHSFGGSIAFLIAAERPPLLQRLVVVAPVVYPPRIGFSGSLLKIPRVGRWAFLHVYGPRLFRHYFQTKVVHRRERVPLELIDHYYDRFTARTSRESAYEVFLRMSQLEPVQAALPSVEQPVLILWGSHDKLLPVSHASKVASLLPRARLHVMQDVGHAPNEELPVETADAIRQFCERGVTSDVP